MAYDLYLGKMLMPITPSKIQMAIDNQNKTITLINDGEINLLKAAGLTTIKFTLLIPQVSYPFARYGGNGFIGAENYLNYFEQLKTAKEPFQFIVSRCLPTGKLLFDTNITVSLEDYTITEEAKNGFDLEVSVTLKQYKHFATKTISVEIPSPTAPIIVNENRPIIWNPTPSTSSSSGGGDSGGRLWKEIFRQLFEIVQGANHRNGRCHGKGKQSSGRNHEGSGKQLERHDLC